jgi:DNA-directed RNA polymerase subunit beta'
MPSQDMVLGCYYLTLNNIQGLLGSSHYFSNLDDVILAYNQNQIEIHSSIWVRIPEKTPRIKKLLKTVELPDNTILFSSENSQIRKTKDGEIIVQYLKMTTGRAILNYIIKKTLNFLET